MNIIEILERPSPAFYTVEELQFAISKFILQKKNKEVEVNIFKNINADTLTAQDIFKLDGQYVHLMNAFEIVQREYDKTKT